MFRHFIFIREKVINNILLKISKTLFVLKLTSLIISKYTLIVIVVCTYNRYKRNFNNRHKSFYHNRIIMIFLYTEISLERLAMRNCIIHIYIYIIYTYQYYYTPTSLPSDQMILPVALAYIIQTHTTNPR